MNPSSYNETNRNNVDTSFNKPGLRGNPLFDISLSKGKSESYNDKNPNSDDEDKNEAN